MILETETFERWMHEIIARLDRQEHLLQSLKGTGIKEAMYVDGERLLDNQDLCQLLQTSKQSLQRYRSSGMLRYRKLRHKTYYTESDVQEFLKKLATAWISRSTGCRATTPR